MNLRESYNDTFVELTNIGSGGFGTVHKIQNKNDDKIYAIKIQQINDLNKYEKSNAFNEGKKLLLLQSEYVVKYYDSWREGNCIYIQMELCSQNLRNVIKIKPQVFGRQLGYPMDCVEYFISCEIFRQILESVQYLHELKPQIIHRDLKPDNILISENVKNGRFVKLCDFGLATVHDMSLQSEYVVQYYDSWREGNCIYIQMELCSQSLQNIIENKPLVFGRQKGHSMGCVEYFISCEIFRQILESVQYLHELNPQIIHRDLKPDNILIAENVKNGRFVKLCDFGLATVHYKRIHYRTTQKHTADVGHIKYMAPEVSQGEKYGHKSDIYSLALIGGELFDVKLNEIDLDEYFRKPDNILIAENVKNGRFVKLCDFGLATVHDKRIHYRTTQKHTADVGDMKYMAPESKDLFNDISHSNLK
ncbi:unnamed protein product [Oppiella nova]|uniref:Protein kinase domain-containing protein n=1 Tax=Oppiella nova TaxID=334625 RepID=A0A7R9QDF8_9ACAR|nr:unnamed protein product [Oppiella nova]CAG2163101.1 unnamed protein product [Oppiella nova]